MEKIPLHIAIIMDGNGRWAQQRGLPRIKGHEKGINNVREILKAAKNLGVKILTLFCFSTENWKRPKKEVDFLMKKFEYFLKKERKNLKKEKIRLKVIGNIKKLPLSLQKEIKKTQDYTSLCDEFILNLAINYGGRDEIIQATKKIIKDVEKKRLNPEEINEETFKNYLYTKDIPDPDLLIRTSGEMRISNFLLWQLSYTEFYFTPKFWPDFKKEDLEEAIKEFSKRERRFGGLKS